MQERTAEPGRQRPCWIIDPSLFSAPYDFHLCDALAQESEQVTLFARELRERESIPPKNFAYRSFFYKYSEKLIASKRVLLQKLGKSVKLVEHCLGMTALVAAARKARPGVVHFFWVTIPFVDRRAIRALRDICPVVVTVHNSVPFHGVKLPFQALDAHIDAYAQADALVAHVEKTRETIVGWGIPSHKIAMISHPPLSLESAGPIRPRIDGRKRVLLFGAIKPYKGLDTLVPAFIRAAAENDDLDLRVVGKAFYDIDHYRAECVAAGLERRVVFDLEFKSERALDEELQSSDIIVLPYHEIDGSGAFATALGYGKAIILSDVGYFSTLPLDPAVRVIAVTPPHDAQALGRSIATLATDRAAYDANAAAFRTVRASLASWRQVGKTLAGVYGRLADDRA